jgi:hypothetical protein
MLALDMGSQFVLGHTWLSLALTVGPRSVERGALFGCWEYPMIHYKMWVSFTFPKDQCTLGGRTIIPSIWADYITSWACILDRA